MWHPDVLSPGCILAFLVSWPTVWEILDFSRQNFKKNILLILSCTPLTLSESKQVEFTQWSVVRFSQQTVCYRRRMEPAFRSSLVVRQTPWRSLGSAHEETRCLEAITEWGFTITCMKKNNICHFCLKVLIYHVPSRAQNVFISPNRMPCLQANRMLD